MWAVEWTGMGNESSPRAFVEFGEHPIGERLKRPANAVLTGKRQCQPGGKQGAENERGGHGEGAPWGEEERSGRERERSLLMAIFALNQYAGVCGFF